jgi:sulfur-carrier protein
MTIKILVFGQISDIIPQKEMNFSNIKTTEELNRELIRLYPDLAQINYSLALNKKIVNQAVPLNEHDTVALLPAFSGG